ncbi:MAG TPA: response regulator [Steroidobacteraceae bacterium]|nr:response regulator [Steroidobacteraceae bacterium]
MAIIDDDASANRALGRLLRGAGFEPSGFNSAESYLADPLRRSFACVLADIQLTGMSGLELQQKLQALGNHTPVIFITAHDEPDYRAEAVRRGCMGFFRKTDPGALIVDALRRAITTSRTA